MVAQSDMSVCYFQGYGNSVGFDFVRFLTRTLVSLSQHCQIKGSRKISPILVLQTKTRAIVADRLASAELLDAAVNHENATSLYAALMKWRMRMQRRRGQTT
jgi:hypothetical protein